MTPIYQNVVSSVIRGRDWCLVGGVAWTSTCGADSKDASAGCVARWHKWS